MKKRLVAFLLVLIMVLGMLPVSAFAVETNALVSNETQKVRYKILYIDDSYNLGYNYGAEVNKEYTCQYSEGHSGYNHSIAVKHIWEVGVPALKDQLLDGYEFVGWAKQGDNKARIWPFDESSGKTAATQTTYTIWLVAKKPTPTKYTYHLIHEFNYVGGTRWDITATTAAESYQLDVNKGKPTRDGYTFLGWADDANATTAQYFGGELITLTKDNPTKTIYAVWKENPPLDIPTPNTDNIAENLKVKVVCTTPESGHDAKFYSLIDGTFTHTDIDQSGDYPTCSITITPDSYISKYSDDTNCKHTTNDQPKTVPLFWNKEEQKWAVNDGQIGLNVVVFNAACEKTPELPEIDEALVGGSGFNFHCVTEGAEHNNSNNTLQVTLRSHPDAYTINKDIKWQDDPHGVNRAYFTVTVTDVAAYLPDFNTHYGEHAICEGEPETLTLTFWLLDSGRWSQWRAQTVNVKCVKAPEKPKAPNGGFDIKCVNGAATHEHAYAAYSLTFNGIKGYDISEVQNDDQGYFVTATVTVAPYLAHYNTFTGVEHRLVSEDDATLTITFRYNEAGRTEAQKWKQQGEKPVVEVTCALDAPTADEVKKALGDVTVKCVNPTTGTDDCTDVKYWAAGGNFVGEAVKVTDTQYTVEIGAPAFLNAYNNRGAKIAHDLYSKETLTWVLNYDYEQSKWVGTPETAGEDDVILVTHAPQKWEEVGKMGKDAEGKSTGIKATCITGGYGPITYGLTTAFVYYDTDVISVEYQGEGRYLATFKTDKYVENIGKGCNDHAKDTRSHKFTSGNEVVQWYLSVGEKDETTGKYSWYSEPKTEADGSITVVHDVTVIFDPNGGSVTPETKNVMLGEAYGELPVPTRKGYTFDGWYTEAEEGTVVTADTTVTATTDHTLYAHWTLIPPAADSKPSYSGVNVRVKCVDNKSEHKQGAYFYGLVYGLSDYSGINEPESWVEEDGEYFYTLTINKDVYIARYANTTKTAHTEVGENKTEVKWQWNGTKWVLLNEKDDKGIVLTINVKCEEKQVVNVVIYRNGNTEKAYQTVALEKMPKGTVIDLSKLNIADYYTAECEFYGWFNDGAWNEYKKNPERAGLETITVNGWTNIICMVYDYENVVYFQSAEDLAAYQADHSKTEGLLFTTKALHGSALPTADAPTATRDGYTFTYWSREGQSVDVTGQTVNGWTNLYANWEITPNKIYAYARLNSYFAPLTTSEFDTPVTLNEATLSRLGLGSYNSLGYISIGSFTFDAMPLTSDLYFDDDAELSAVAEKLATDIALETGVSDKIAEKIAWTALYKTVNEEDMEPGYPAADGYQLNGSLNLATVMFAAGGENVKDMPVDNYVYDDVVGLYDFYYTGDTFTLPTTEPTRAGYDFKGWEATVLGDEIAVNSANIYQAGDTYEITKEGVKFTAKWEARNDTPYKVEHYLESLDGTYTLDTTEPLKGTTDTTATAAAKSYDNFTYDSTVPGTVTSGNIAGDGSLVLKLFYTRNTYDYTVRHIKQLPDGTYDEANAEVETLNGKFEALATVTAKDYGSHYPKNDADTKQNIKIEKNLTIDVKYDLDNHTLTFDTDGGSAIEPITVRHGNAVARPADPTKDKYTFIGWYVDAAFSTEYDFTTVLEDDKTIYAKFELTATPIGDIYVRYDVLHIKQLPDGSYDLANAEVEHLSAKKGATVTALVKNYSATHHINVNSTLSKLTDTAIQPYPGADGKPVYTILSVYYDLDFHTLTFDTMGGSRIDPVTVRHGLTVAKPKDPVNGGYIFDGWYTDKTFKYRYDFSTPLTEDITIYAKWFLIVLPGVTVKKNTPKLNTADHFAYVQGYPDGTVKPTGNITRAETAAILFRLMDDSSRNTYYSTKSGFRDVSLGTWYNTYVATLNNAGVITDSANGYFRPNEAITRAELAAMLANFTETTGAANYFNDVSAKYWAANAIAICAKLGWITGYPDGSFRPDKNVTRAELMAMINRATGRAPKSADAFLSGMKTWKDNTADKWYYLDVQEATNSHSYTVRNSEVWTALNADPNWSKYE